jgi:hypothetical protein
MVKQLLGRGICGVATAENLQRLRCGEFARFASRRICLTPSGGEFKIYDLGANSPLNGSFNKFSTSVFLVNLPRAYFSQILRA